MIRPLRRRHRWMISLLAIVIAAFYLLILTRREPLPRPADERPGVTSESGR